MATNATPLPPVRSPITLIKQEEQAFTITTVVNADNTPPQPPPETPPLFINILAELRNLSTALSTFYLRYDELQNHLDFIKTAIDSKLPDHLNNQLALIPMAETSPKPSLPGPVNPETEPDNTTNSYSEPIPDPQIPNSESKPESTINSETEANCQKPGRSELENLCESMCGRSVRRYITANLSDSKKLREEVPKALKLAANPPKLVLECVGRFYLQGSKAYTKEKPVIEVRRGSILVLECFLLMGCEGLVIESAVEGEAAEAAIAWRKRIVGEGGLLKASEIDARGLLLLISGFGIPNVFKNEDIRDLILATKARRIYPALRLSRYLVPRIPAIIELMVKNNLEVEAADIAYSFGLEGKCSAQKILTTFVRQTTKSKMQGSSEEVKTGKKKQLADLKFVVRCLENHKIDPSDLLPDLKINEKITSLEKEITELDKKAKEKSMAKRKAGETDSKNKSEDVKRSRFTGHTVVHQLSPAGHGDVIGSYSGLGITNSFLDERLRSSNINGYSASPSVPYGSRLPEDITGSIAAGAGLSNGAVNTNPYARVYGQRPAVDSVGPLVNRDGQLYEWREDVALNERLITQAYAGQSHAAPSRGDAALSERLLAQTYAGQTYASQPSSSGLIGLYRPSQSSLEGFAGVPHSSTSAGQWTRGSGSDLYQFADSVLESESYRTSSNRTAALPGHRSSYLY